MAQLVELRPKKDLLHPEFEGYKLTLDPLPVYKHDLPVSVENLKPSSESFSYEIAKMFGFHNHLLDDPWNPELVFFISKDLQVFYAHIHSMVSQSPDFRGVGRIPIDNESGTNEGFFNPSLRFASPHLAVATSGGGNLCLFDTSQRNVSNPQPWQMLQCDQILHGNKPFKILHVLLDETDEDHITNLYVLLVRVEPFGDVETQIPLSSIGCNQQKNPFISLLEFMTYTCKDGHWSFGHQKRLAVPCGVEYASILNPGKSLCIISREPLGIIFDSEKSIESISSNLADPIYHWCESEDEVVVVTSFPKQYLGNQIAVEISAESLKVMIKDNVKIEGDFQHEVSPDLSSWKLVEGKLEIILAKSEKLSWDYLLRHCCVGLKVNDVETAHEWHQRRMTVTSQQEALLYQNRLNLDIEECDIGDVDGLFLFRFDGKTNLISHKAVLGSIKPLFIMPSVPNLAPAICIRLDVDGLIWQPFGDEVEGDWNCQHTATLNAIGYIQSSKETRKFTVCPPNMSYVAICCSMHHIFIYRQPGCSSTGVDMVYRPTGRRVASVARSQIISLENNEVCLGAVATDSFLLILTSSSLLTYRINSD